MSPRWLALALLSACSGAPTTAPPVKAEPAVVPAPTNAPEPEVMAKVPEPEPEPEVVSKGPEAPVAAEPAAPSQQLEVEARLVERPGAVACGGIHAVVVMRYEVVRVLVGDYPHRELFVAHSCPEMGATRCEDLPGERIKRFHVGDTHHLRGAQKRGSGALIDRFADRSLPRYRASCANLVAAAP